MTDPRPAQSVSAALPDDPEDRPRQPEHEFRPAQHPLATVVAAVAVYEVAAVTVNTSLDDELLPSMTALVNRIRWSGALRWSLLASWWAACWTVISIGIVSIAVRSRRSR